MKLNWKQWQSRLNYDAAWLVVLCFSAQLPSIMHYEIMLQSIAERRKESSFPYLT